MSLSGATSVAKVNMKRNSNIIGWISTGFLATVFLVLSADCFAGMAVSPLKQWVEVKPGTETSFSVTVTNANRGPETGPCTVYADVVDFTVSPEGQLSFGPKYKHGRSAVHWISLDAGKFVLEPGESKELRGKVSAPAGADGDYWAAIMLTLGNPKNQEKGIQVVLRTASGVFVRAARRNYIEHTSITDVNVSLPRLAPEKGVPEESTPHQASQEGQTECVLKINACLKNDGLAATEPNGKAFLYAGNSRRIGYIPLYASRRQILPGHTRWFTGVMPQPLAAGRYSVRVFFDAGSKYGRTRTRDLEFSVSQELAAQWAQNFTGDDRQILELNPQKIDLALNPGRFTVTKLLIANTGSGTISVRCRVQNDRLQEGWMKLDCSEFALAPNARRNVVCAVRIPADAQPQDYNAAIQIEVERSGLTGQTENNIMLHEIPVHMLVSKRIAIASEGG
jgi:hypothetical protein